MSTLHGPDGSSLGYEEIGEVGVRSPGRDGDRGPGLLCSSIGGRRPIGMGGQTGTPPPSATQPLFGRAGVVLGMDASLPAVSDTNSGGIAEKSASDLPRSLRLHQAMITGLGIIALGVTTFTAAALQVGASLCACVGSSCTGPQVCPNSIVVLSVVVALLMMESLLIALGLSPRALARGAYRLGLYRPPSSPLAASEPPLHIAAPFLAFLGWALLALGLMLPLDVFGLCHGQSGCTYPWVLTGYPLLVVLIGFVTLAIGSGLFVIQYLPGSGPLSPGEAK